MTASNVKPARTSALPHSNLALIFTSQIVADAETRHGGSMAVMKLTKLFTEKGATGILSRNIPTAIRLRCEQPRRSENGFRSYHPGERDHPFILGCTNPSLLPLVNVMRKVRGVSGDALQVIKDKWIGAAGLKLYSHDIAEKPFIAVGKYGLKR